jgi:hypothetical protein
VTSSICTPWSRDHISSPLAQARHKDSSEDTNAREDRGINPITASSLGVLTAVPDVQLLDEPMRDNNILVRHLKPAGETLGIGWVNWLVLRRSFATWLKMAGADVKDAQAPESQRRVADSLTGLTTLVN